MVLNKKPFDVRLKEAREEQFKKDIDMDTIYNGELKKNNKRLHETFMDRLDEIQTYIGANVYYNRDIQNDNHKYNKLRTKLIEQRKRKEARKATEGI